MSDIAIKVDRLSKSYLVGHKTNDVGCTELRDIIARSAKNLARKTRDMMQGKAVVQGDEIEEFWALKDVSLEIRQGDRVGIIGRNGAGKSTLLKLLSRITEPTKGRIQLIGRVASLLEVGTGFHTELTGRENIFLNGAILGMPRNEIQRKFDEIVDFAEVEKFLDTPVKHYSSGMHIRLAFSVAAHLEPEILIVDEVLAVGDAAFQRKCLGKLDDARDRQGKTVLFVSHQMAAIQSLCTRAIYLSNGCVVADGPVDAVTYQYLKASSGDAASNPSLGDLPRTGTQTARFVSLAILNKEGEPVRSISLGGSMLLRFGIFTESDMSDISIGFSLHDSSGQTLLVNYSEFDNRLYPLKSGLNYIHVIIKQVPLKPSRYSIGIRMTRKGIELDWPRGEVYVFDIDEVAFFNGTNISHAWSGLLALRPFWQ